MSKKDSNQANHDEASEVHNESHNEVHVETHSESHVSTGSAPAAEDLQARIDELTTDLQRVQAEFVNYRRRAESEKAEVLDFAKARIARDFLTVRDSFDAEAAHRPAEADPAWAKSIDAIRTQFDQVLTGLGVVRFESVGQPFDPHLHNAVAMDDSAGSGPEVVIEELQPGYKLGDTVLRHAMVKVGH
jgi:molecular chaperone GrpE